MVVELRCPPWVGHDLSTKLSGSLREDQTAEFPGEGQPSRLSTLDAFRRVHDGEWMLMVNGQTGIPPRHPHGISDLCSAIADMRPRSWTAWKLP